MRLWQLNIPTFLDTVTCFTGHEELENIIQIAIATGGGSKFSDHWHLTVVVHLWRFREFKLNCRTTHAP